MTSRRVFLAGTAGVTFASLLPEWARAAAGYPVSFTEAEWRKRLSRNQYAVLRESGTERAYSSALLKESRPGTFACAGCANPLFSSSTKFDSRTGWPSFWAPLANAVGEERDASLGMARTAVHCARCGGHQGHVFNDGPQPTGLRYCMNGISMTFRPGAA